MNKQLRYSSHILAILLMTGSMQSLTANRVYFSNESNKSNSPHRIHVDITYFIEYRNHITPIACMFCIDPGKEQLWPMDKIKSEKRYTVKRIELHALYSSKENDLYKSPSGHYDIHLDTRLPEFQTSYEFCDGVSYNIQNPDHKNLKVIYKGNESFEIVLLDWKEKQQ